MNFEKVEQLIKIVKDNGVKKFNYKDYENEITIDFTDNTSASPAQQQLASNNESTLNEQGISNEEQSNQAVKSPMVGTFYLQDEKGDRSLRC